MNSSLEKEAYFDLLISNSTFPVFLLDYLAVPEMQRLKGIGMCCGVDYTNLLPTKYFYSVYDHSLGVALLVWRFTRDRSATLAALFHDIATPVFKHCVDILDGDSEKQESTEAFTENFICQSTDICRLLNRDGIPSWKVTPPYDDYPVLENDLPALCADRLEYNLSGGLVFNRVWELDEIENILNDLCILEHQNESQIGFRTLQTAEDFISHVSRLWPSWVCDEDRLVTGAWAHILGYMLQRGLLHRSDLYRFSETDIIALILSSQDEYLVRFYKRLVSLSSNDILVGGEDIKSSFRVSFSPKRRYLDPLVRVDGEVARVSECSSKAKQLISEYFSYPLHAYVGFNI